MKRKFLANIAFLVPVSILIKAFWVLGIDRTVQNAAGAEAYGTYFTLFSLAALFTLALDMGLAGYNNRTVASDRSAVSILFGNILAIRLALVFIYSSITLGSALLLGYSAVQTRLLLLIMLNQVMVSFTLWLRSTLSALQYLFIDSVLSVADRLVMIIICSVLLWSSMTVRPFPITWFILAQTASCAIILAVTAVAVLRIGKISFSWPERHAMVKILKEGLPYAVVTFAMTLYWRSDAVIMERILPDGAASAGNYAQAFRLFDAAAMIPVMAGSLLMPILSDGLARKTDVRPVLGTAARLIVTPVTIAAVIVATFPKEILSILYDNPSPEAETALTILMAALIPLSVTFIYSTLLTSSGNIRALGVITSAAALLSITMNLLIIPRLSFSGAAVTALVTWSAVATASAAIAGKCSGTGISSRQFLSFLAVIAVTVVTGIGLRMTPLAWYAAATLQAAIATASALALRLVDPLKGINMLLHGK